MIWQHVKAVVWLRWRLSVNQWRRGGSLNAIFGGILLVAFTIAALFSFFMALLIGIFTLPDIAPDELLLVWDVILGVFLFMWVMGLVTELQKSEALSLEKLLHLPLSLTGVYLLNYLSSWMSLSLVLFLPTATGLCLALVIVKGASMLILFPLLLSFVIMITAISHQFRGWLQVLMVNKRRRRTIIALVSGVFILLVQVPNMVNIAVQRSRKSDGPSAFEQANDQLMKQLEQQEIDAAEYESRYTELTEQRDAERAQRKAQKFSSVVEVAMWANLIVPLGWLPLGARSAAAGSAWPGLLGSMGALLIGAASLWRSYRTTLRFYTGGFGAGQKKKKKPQPSAHPEQNFLEKRIAGAPDQAAAVMLGSLRSMLRGPEGKMLLLTPLLLLGFFSIMFFWRHNQQVPAQARPLLGIGAITMIMLSFVQVLCNQFGFDRNGFRALVLSPCPRRHILLGKNLAVAPLALGVGTVALAAIQFFVMLKFTHLLATFVQMLVAYVLICLLGNVISVLAPSAVASGALKPAKSKILTIVIHVFAALFSPISVAPGAIILGVELLVHEAGWMTGVPIYLLGSVIELAAVIWLYRKIVPLEGQFLQRREQAILDAVTARAE